MSMMAFNFLVKRAQQKADSCMSLLQGTPITTNVKVVLDAAEYINELEVANTALKARLAILEERVDTMDTEQLLNAFKEYLKSK